MFNKVALQSEAPSLTHNTIYFTKIYQKYKEKIKGDIASPYHQHYSLFEMIATQSSIKMVSTISNPEFIKASFTESFFC